MDIEGKEEKVKHMNIGAKVNWQGKNTQMGGGSFSTSGFGELPGAGRGTIVSHPKWSIDNGCKKCKTKKSTRGLGLYFTI